ncbi:MAG: hypothetical protein FJX75_10245 [Armatimonadetes bacterium]|nr:hypothetical protein [Armatimonadota bacterium]
MRALRILAICVGLPVASTSLVNATPSTIIYIPSTDTLAKGTVHLDYDTLFTVGRGKGNSTAASIGALYGVTDRLEVGLDYLTSTGNPLVGNAKYKVWNDDRFAVAVGAWLLGDEGTTGVNQVYGLASYNCKDGRFAAGFAHGSKTTLGTDEDQFWLSYDKVLNDRWWVGADYVSGDSAMGSLNLGVGYTLADNVSMILGCDLYNASGANDTVTVQLDASF